MDRLTGYAGPTSPRLPASQRSSEQNKTADGCSHHDPSLLGLHSRANPLDYAREAKLPQARSDHRTHKRPSTASTALIFCRLRLDAHAFRQKQSAPPSATVLFAIEVHARRRVGPCILRDLRRDDELPLTPWAGELQCRASWHGSRIIARLARRPCQSHKRQQDISGPASDHPSARYESRVYFPRN
jgi:hypothetical protein